MRRRVTRDAKVRRADERHATIRIRRLTLPFERAYHPPDDERAMRHWAPGAFACLLGSHAESRGRMERIAQNPNDEADLPAQEAPSRKGARLPRPDEDHRGTPRLAASPAPGPEPPAGRST